MNKKEQEGKRVVKIKKKYQKRERRIQTIKNKS
jgi:hypothetical protein